MTIETISNIEPAIIFNEVSPKPKRVLDILDNSDQEEAIQSLVGGGTNLTECGGPIGFMAATKRFPDEAELEEGVNRLQRICFLKGKKLKESPFIQYVPPEGLDKVIDYEEMARIAGIEEQRYKYALKKAMVRSGAIFQIMPEREIVNSLPFSCLEVTIDGKAYPTLGVSCPNEFYPALGRIVSGVWEKDMMVHITSANVHNQPTLTEMDEAIKLLGENDMVIVDNPDLRDEMKVRGIKPSSYTLVLTVNSGKEISMGRQGKESPIWVIELLNEGLGDEFYRLGKIGTKLLSEPPYNGETVDLLWYRKLAGSLGRNFLARRP